MAKDKVEAGEQLELIDITPEYAKPIKAAARAYKKAMLERVAVLAEEVKCKGKIIAAVRDAKIKPNAEGVIEFRLDGVTIKITPRDELVSVKLDDSEE